MGIVLKSQDCATQASVTATFVANGDGTATVTFPPGAKMAAGSYSFTGVTPTQTQQAYCVVWTINCSASGTLTIDNTAGQETLAGTIACATTFSIAGSGLVITTLTDTDPLSGSGSGGTGGQATPELSSSALFSIGLVPTLLILYRRRGRQKRALQITENITE